MRKLLLSLLIIFIFAASAFAGPSMQTGSTYDPANVAITGGTINGTTIGATTPAAGTFTTIKTMDNIADTTLSGTPKVFVIYDSTGTPYYFKAYPVKQ